MSGQAKLMTAGGGGVILTPASSVASDVTVSVPSVSGTVMNSGNMPAFSVYLSANQTVSANASTKVAFNTKEFDTNNNFDAVVNYRFTPTVAGYYQINFMLAFPNGAGANNCISQLYKNGSLYLTGTRTDTVSAGYESLVSTVVYFNGSTDYVEGYGYTSGTTFAGGATGAVCKFSGVLMRAV